MRTVIGCKDLQIWTLPVWFYHIAHEPSSFEDRMVILTDMKPDSSPAAFTARSLYVGTITQQQVDKEVGLAQKSVKPVYNDNVYNPQMSLNARQNFCNDRLLLPTAAAGWLVAEVKTKVGPSSGVYLEGLFQMDSTLVRIAHSNSAKGISLRHLIHRQRQATKLHVNYWSDTDILQEKARKAKMTTNQACQ